MTTYVWKFFGNAWINGGRLLAAAEAGNICYQSTVYMLNVQKYTKINRWGDP